MSLNIEIIAQKLNPPLEFDFPFTPYEIQNEFMKNLYTVIEENKLGIFESPTGTGKSLSIICGALRWLQDHEVREKSELETTITKLKNDKKNLDSDGNDWINSQSKQIEITKQLRQLQNKLNQIEENDKNIVKLKDRKKVIDRKRYKSNVENVLRHSNVNDDKLKGNDDLEFLLDNNSGEEDESDDEIQKDELDKYENVKIFICSRTHSQITQLVNEVKKTPFSNNIRLVSLASRQNYCINPSVNKLTNLSLINERCLDLQKSKTKSTASDSSGRATKKKKTSCSCPYMQQKTIEDLRDISLIEIQDVEQLTQTAKKMNACPYYATRSAIRDAQLVFLPYNLILHKQTRESSGIKLKNNVVIIDEAHNLLESLAEMHNSQINGHQLLHAHNQLTEYSNRYKTKFSAYNLLQINQLLFIIGKFINMIGGKPGCKTNESCTENESKLFTLQDFVVKADIDHLNLYRLLKFCSTSKLSQKLNGFSLKYQPTVTIHEMKPKETGLKAFLKQISVDQTTDDQQPQPTNEFISKDFPRNPFLFVVAFLEALTHKCEDGRVICVKGNTIGKGFLKFLLLNPSSHFEKIVQEARSVIVAGGTMKPMYEFSDRLFKSSGATLERIQEFCCDHIVPPENILPIVLSAGPTGQTLDFSYSYRNSPNILNELGRLLQNICNIIPGGIVCFFPSYDYEMLVHNHFEKNKVLEQISTKKQIFREPKSSADSDKVLSQYSRAVKNCVEGKTGALMFSVVGGKLSEGLNFSDDLGRCVVVIGLPYPNIKSPELQEKMSYLNKKEGGTAGNIYYENLCMKAVNQCIGRAVRHKNDFANVLLLDKRFLRPKTQQALPFWIQKSLVNHEKFGPAFAAIAKFFSSKKKKNNQ